MALQDRCAVVTGAASGIGAAVARAFVEQGARVLLTDVQDEPGRELAGQLGDAARYHHLDVSREEEWPAALGTAEETFGPLSILVNNAGVGHWAPLARETLDGLWSTLRVNLGGAFLGMRAALPRLRAAGGGHIVNVSSIVGTQAGYRGLGAYAASKAGVAALTTTAALEANDGSGAAEIFVNAVYPGQIVTPMIAGFGDDVIDHVPLKRFGDVRDVAQAVLYLAQVNYVLGTGITIEGGGIVGPPPSQPPVQP